MKKIILIILVVVPIIGFGQCIDGNCENGVGTYLWDDGSVSNGPWKNGELNGIVQEISYDEEGNLIGSFDGEMVMGVENGWGVETLYQNGKLLGTYVGNWRDGDYNGWGIWIEPDGYTEKGIHRNGELID
tara:strand:- start:64 stop:453 length:390 start_codon:yes stop_codon:yes gene_type:complete